MIRLPLAVPTALAALVLAAPAGAVAAPAQQRPLRNVDVRAADGGPVSAPERRARAAFERALGDEGVVSTDRVSGAARLVARTDGFLTAPRSAPPTDIALGYVRARPGVFGLDAADLDGLRLESRYRSLDGVTHLAYTQTQLGVAAYDNVLLANVDGKGRLLNVGGAAVSDLRVPSVTPDLDAEAALAAARREVGGVLVPPRASQGRGPERPTRFSGGDTARLTLFNDGPTTRLAWRVEVTGEHDYVYELVLDATSGKVLKRRSLTEFASNAGVYENFPGAPSGGAAVTVDLAADPTWLSQAAGGTRLSGNNAHAFVDADSTDGPSAGDVEVPASSGMNWLYALMPFNVPGQTCSPPGCTWNSNVPGTRTTNRNQATTQLFYLVNAFHDHLEAAPIGFTPAAGNFELLDPGAGVGGDPVLAETDNFDNPPVAPATTSTNNASMTTRPDGISPRLEMFLFTNPSLDAADTADVVYHEYTHGLTNRSVGSGVGLDANQSRAIGEGWSDWYALDLLETQGLRPDAPATPGEMTIGGYLVPGGFRTQGADCAVNASAAACPGTATAGGGGYTLGDMGSIGPSGFEIHDDGEIWLETLWDLRAALGTATAESLVTSGLRLSPNNPSFIEARDAILLADQIVGGANYETLWSVFAARGLGYGATTTSSAATTAVEAFDLPPRLVAASTSVSDPAPGGDGDDVAEPGETISVTETLRNPRAPTVAGISGVLSTTTPHVGVTQPNATWPAIDPGLTRTSSPPFRVSIPTSASCDTNVQLELAMTTNQGSFSLPLRVPVGSAASVDVPKTISGGGVDSTLTFDGAGAVHGLKVRIDRLTHTFVGDLVMTLRSPTGRTVVLMDRPGTSATSPEGSQGDDFFNLVLDDGAATAIQDLPGLNPPGGYTGSFRPHEPLSAFDGENRQGPWTLHVSDAFPSDDSGTLQAWGLRPSRDGCANSAPIAVDDAYTANAGQTLVASSVLANDTDADGNALTAVKVSDPAHGTLALAADGTFSYAPEAGYRGPDSFTYRAHDGTVASPDAATVNLTVGNDGPLAVDDAYTVAAGTRLSGSSVLANDSDPNDDTLSAVPATGPQHGTLALAPNGTFAYTPADGFTGRDTFTYRAADATESSSPATVTITVTSASRPAPAKLEVLRAGVSGGRLDVLAAITARATGTVRVSYRSAGRTTRFDAAIRRGRIRFRKGLPRSQRSKPTGIVTLVYRGTAAVQPDSVTLRAARGKARLVRTTSRIDSRGRLRVAGTITPRARGVVRVRLGYSGAGGVVRFLDYRAKIAAGRWSVSRQLPAATATAGGQLSIQFTGYEPRRIRGEQIAKEVKPRG
jgi:subtilisin-like proprotein convertase family protein